RGRSDLVGVFFVQHLPIARIDHDHGTGIRFRDGTGNRLGRNKIIFRIVRLGGVAAGSSRPRSGGGTVVSIRTRARGFRSRLSFARGNASWPDNIRIVLIRRNVCRLCRETGKREEDRETGGEQARPTLHAAAISDKDSTRASCGYKSFPG